MQHYNVTITVIQTNIKTLFFYLHNNDTSEQCGEGEDHARVFLDRSTTSEEADDQDDDAEDDEQDGRVGVNVAKEVEVVGVVHSGKIKYG